MNDTRDEKKMLPLTIILEGLQITLMSYDNMLRKPKCGIVLQAVWYKKNDKMSHKLKN